MSEQESPPRYFKGPEGDIICLIKTDKEAQYTFGNVIRFNPEGMIVSRLYHNNIVEIADFYGRSYPELELREAQLWIEEFERAFEEITRYGYGPEKKTKEKYEAQPHDRYTIH